MGRLKEREKKRGGETSDGLFFYPSCNTQDLTYKLKPDTLTEKRNNGEEMMAL